MATRKRLDNLTRIIDQTAAKKTDEPYRILEVGVYLGDSAEMMITRAMSAGRKVRYFGFDLFELSTEETRKAERRLAEDLLTKKNKPSPPLTRERIQARLRPTGATVELYEGFTKDTLAAFAARMGPDFHVDVVFLDASHLPENIAIDWAHVTKVMGPETICVFDDYIEEREDFGCKPLISELQKDPAWKAEILEPADKYDHIGISVRCALARRS